MTDEQRQRAMEVLTAQAKEAVIVKVLERIAVALEGVLAQMEDARANRQAEEEKR